MHLSFNFSLLLLCCHFGVFGVYKFVVRCSFGLCVELFSFIVFFSPSLSVRCRQQLQRRRRRRQRFCLFFFLLSVICALLHKYICIYCFFSFFHSCVCSLFRLVSVLHTFTGTDRFIGFFYIFTFAPKT